MTKRISISPLRGKPLYCLKLWVTAFIMILGYLVPVASVAQRQGGITLSLKQVPLETVFEKIQEQTTYRFVYNDNLLVKAKKVSIDVRNSTIETVLSQCLNGQPFSYTIQDNNILITPKKEDPLIRAQAPTMSGPDTVTVSGQVLGMNGAPLAGATIAAQGTTIGVATNADGYFTMNLPLRSILSISYIGYQPKEIKIISPSQERLIIHLESAETRLDAIDIVSTGYQTLPKERATGSFEHIGNNLFNRTVSSSVLDHIKNLSAGIFYNESASTAEPILIRGRSTIYSGTSPLVVVDNFPYDGDINNLNPNDIESVTILKDAAAASIWGARAGNGVIVITTKKGKTQKSQVALNNSVTIKPRPDLMALPTISSGDYIDLEKKLFEEGYYTDDENNNTFNNGHPPFTPVVELLREARDGKISSSEANTAIEQMKKFDARKDIEKYLYRTSFSRQHSLNVSGNSSTVNYYLSVGWDNNQDNLVGKSNDRVSLRSQQTFKVSSNLQIDAGISYISNGNIQGNNSGYLLNNGSTKHLYPYARLVDSNGNPTTLIRDYNAGFVQSAEEAGLYNWNYNPIHDINYSRFLVRTNDLVANTGLRYRILKGLDLDLKYQYESQQTRGKNTYDTASYYVRSLVNQFAQVDADGNITYPIPIGAVIDYNNAELTSHQGRAQLNYHTRFHREHEISALAGGEIKSIRVTNDGHRIYGFDQNGSTVNSILDYKTLFQQYDNIYNLLNIPTIDAISGTTNRYFSYYANASYTYKDRYIFSGSAREDASNLFGVKTNQKSVPLWSTGIAWLVDNEPGYHLDWLPQLKLRATYGYQGNVYNQATAYATATYNIFANTGLTSGTIQSPPNENLRWEKNATFNIGADFTFSRNIISGSIDYYRKRSRDLMGYAPVDPTLGLAVLYGTSTFFGNVAGMKGQGIDLTINANIPLVSKLKWNSAFLFSYNRSIISSYSMPVSPIGSNYIQDGYIKPVVGKPVYAVYSYKWAGLEPTTGNPQGYLNGKLSTDYGSILSTTSLDSMKYNGQREPKFFGAWRNAFTYKNISLSFNISYKLGYYFRRPSIDYTSLFSTWTGNSDYSLRWQKEGDEKQTNVPSLVYPADYNRDRFYANSDILVQKGDHIRLEDATVTYSLNKADCKWLPLAHIRVYGYISNLGLLWKANKSGIDPDYLYYPYPRKSYALGFNFDF